MTIFLTIVFLVHLISWVVVGERQDEHMYETEWTDENGHVILEPEIPEGVIL